jgi:hypothetical protein
MRHLIFLTALIFCCCGYFSDSSTVIIKFPKIPPHWQESFPDLRLLIKYPDKENKIIEEIYSLETGSIEIECEKMTVIPIAAYPITGSFIFPPAGGIYPYSTDMLESMQLKWEYGITADILITLISGEMDVNTFNSERLYNEINLRAPPDPFKLNKQKIIDAILSGNFRVTDIKPLEEKEMKINLYSGTWFTESPFSELYEVNDEVEENISFTYGFHILHNSVTGDHYDIYTDSSITVVQYLKN